MNRFLARSPAFISALFAAAFLLAVLAVALLFLYRFLAEVPGDILVPYVREAGIEFFIGFLVLALLLATMLFGLMALACDSNRLLRHLVEPLGARPRIEPIPIPFGP